MFTLLTQIGLPPSRLVRFALVFGSLMVLLALPHLSRARWQSRDAAQGAKRYQADSVPGEMLVRFRENTPAAKSGPRSELLIEQGGGELLISLEQLTPSEVVTGLRLARVAPADTQRAIQALRARADVVYAEPNYIRRKDSVPNDTHYGDLWGLKNTGQNSGTAGVDIKAEQAWDVTTGSRNIVVAVIDEGIDVNHTDLQPNIWQNPGEVPGNGFDDDGNGYVDDRNGFDFFHNDGSVYDGPGQNPDGSAIDAHGTHVAGTIGAHGNNGTGVVGVNWEVSLMSLKFLGPEGGTSADAVRAYTYVKMMRDRWINSGGTTGANIRITNNSYGGGSYSQAEADGIQAMASSGVLFVASAGNDADDNNLSPSFPATYDLPSVISVAAIDRRGALSSFSNRGSRTVHLAAPGSSVLSTTPGNSFTLFNGTSMASPHVAGAAALLLTAHSDFTVARLRGALLFGAEASSATNQTTVTGGRLSAFGALQNANEVDTTAPAAISNLANVDQDGRFVALNWTAPGDDGNGGQAALYEIRFVSNTGASFLLDVFRPGSAGTAESRNVNVPFRHGSGYFEIRTLDNAGNSSNTSINVSVSTPEIVDPYIVTTGAAEPLSTGGSSLGLFEDDGKLGLGMPFNFPFFDRYYDSIVISTNGTIYFGSAPNSDPFNNTATLNGRAMIAGMWDDLDLRGCFRANSGVYRTTPDNDRIIYRWEGVRFTSQSCPATPTGANPVNFEIELRRDGTIKTRYGQNTPLHPVVGIGGGEPEGYLIASHTSPENLLDLTNAATVTYSLRTLPRQTDLSITSTPSPNVVLAGQNVTFNLTATNLGPNRTAAVKIVNTIPVGTSSFVSCTSSQGSCSGFSNGSVQIDLGLLESGATATAAVTVQATGGSGQFINQAAISTILLDPNPGNNTASSFVEVVIPNSNPQTGIIGIGAGSGHSFGIRSDGNALAWGADYAGQLGDNSLVNKAIPVRVNTISSVASIDGGSSHSLALKTDGSVWAWGRNDLGQVGDGTTTDRLVPTMTGLSGVIKISAGGNHSLALRNDGTVWAWGGNSHGQLGDGTTVSRSQPAQISALSGITGISAGYNYSLAVKNDGTVWAWGGNEHGQLGDSSNTQRLTPVLLAGLSNVSAVFANDLFAFLGPGGVNLVIFSVALRNDGTVWTWGHNWRGQLGDGTTNNRSTPGQVQGITGVTSIAAGGFFVSALRNDGTVWSWGGNFSGHLGDTTTTDRHVPGPVVWLTGIQAIVAGTEHTLALRQDGHILGWGSTHFGQLGFGSIGGHRPYPYEVSLQVPDPPPQGGPVQFSSATYSVAENGGTALVTVSRSGDSSIAASVNYATNDTAGLTNCNVVNGVGSSRCDYATSVGIVRFAVGETAKTISIPIVDDSYAEGNENFTITLSNATGASLGAPATATVTISDNEVVNGANPIDQTAFFVRQQYVDFLGREPDPGGFAAWQALINNCPPNDTTCDRIHVSSAFFRSPEFQDRGYFVYRFYPVAFGRKPEYAEFIPDLARVSGFLTAAELEAAKVAFIAEFMNRPAFVTKFGALNNTQYVDALLNTAQITHPNRDAWIAALGAGTKTRAEVLREIAESTEVFNKYFNQAFVVMQYFGYLRRDPDAFYLDWIAHLDSTNDFRSMINGFMNSLEYRFRFGP